MVTICSMFRKDTQHMGMGVGNSLMAMDHCCHYVRRSALSSYWLRRMSLLPCSFRMRHIVGVEQPQHPRHQDMKTSYSEFLSTHLPLFSRAKVPLKADDWLRTTESKFSLLHCIEYQKTLYTAQQLRGSAGA
jgi:hypothetical protein